MESCIPLTTLSESEIMDVSYKAIDWALLHGAVMRRKTNFSENDVSFAPFTLLPSVFNKNKFEEVIKLQTSVNELIHRVACDHEFLAETLKNTIESDDFTGRLFDIYNIVRKEGSHQSWSCGILRNDVMESVKGVFKQVELNSISSGFGWLGPVSASIHRFDCVHKSHFA